MQRILKKPRKRCLQSSTSIDRVMKMDVKEIAAIAGREVSEIESKVKEEQVQNLIKAIHNANKIYVCGAGRSLLMLRCFAMRLMHVGFDAYVVGDTTTPAFEEGDLLIVGTASGETSNLISIAKRAKGYGGTIATCSIFAESSLGKLADVFVKIPAYTDKLPVSAENQPNILPGGSMFEISMLVLYDSMILPLAEEKSVATNKSFARHANLE